MSRSRVVVNPARDHDCLYDPNFHVSSYKDHVKAVHRTGASIARLQKMPIPETMFADSSHYPRSSMRLNPQHPVPNFVSRQWHDETDYKRDIIETYTKQNYAPSLKLPPKDFEKVEATGKDNHKFFFRPVVPFMQQMQPSSVFYGPIPGLNNITVREVKPEPPVKTVGTQTDYRESETQTDPYSPHFTVLPGTEPEELLVQQLAHGKGLPAGLDEVEFIERARAKRAWERRLPPIDDVSQLETRKRMMEEQERAEWAVREREIERIQNLQLQALTRGLEEREEKHAEINRQRLEKKWADQQEVKKRKLKRLRHHHSIQLRQLMSKHSNPENHGEKRDLLRDYSDPSSKVFAPLLRDGVFADSGSEQNIVTSRFLTTYQGLIELEADIPQFLLEHRVKAPIRPEQHRGTRAARRRKYKQDLKDVYDTLRSTSKAAAGSLRLLEKVEKPKIRPPTPTVDTPSEEKMRLEKAVVHLQAVVRGRGVQKKMIGGLEDSRRFIDELKVAVPLQGDIAPKVNERRNTVLAAQRVFERMERDGQDAEMAASHHITADAGRAINTLQKELIRLKEERRIHAIMMLAERERRKREAMEAGRRQKEELRRRKDDEIFRQVAKVQQATVEEYLQEFVIDASIEHHATEEAKQSVEEMIVSVNNFNADFEQRVNRTDSVELASRLVHAFLVPEPDKMIRRQEVRRNQEVLIRTAHSRIRELAFKLEKDTVAEGFSPAWDQEPDHPTDAANEETE